MKRSTYISIGLVVLFLLISLQALSQNFEPFTPRFNQDLKGDIVLIGNNILGPDNNAFNNNSVYNHTVDMQYIDIDGDASTFNSSSADLVIPDPNCYRIIHAGLYWGAVTNGAEPIANVKFRGPTGGYNDIVGTVIFDANGTSVDGGNSFPYACYADVTSIVNSFGSDLGTYTVANVSTAQGQTDTYTPRNGTGNSAGWSLFIVYENPTMPGKSITSFDGFSSITRLLNPTLDTPVSGFRTVPAPAPVRANFAFAALEGDSPIPGDQLLLNGINLSTVDRPATNFFNSSVTQLSATPVNNRNPNSTNTLGFDTGIIAVPNPNNSVIANSDTSAIVRLESTQDTYFPYFFALAVEIIEPNIVLTKIVEDAQGNDIGDQEVDLGDELNYVIGFQNTGNDNATNLIIRDVLPINIVFNYPEDLSLLPPGVTVQSYDPVTREIIFSVDNSVVEENDPVQAIRFKVMVVRTCSLLNDACDNIIENQAFATYNGTLNPTFTISDDPSFNSNSGCLLNPVTTNFLADIDCTFTEQVILCGASTVLTAGDGYDSYSWSTSPTGTPVIGTTQSITVTTTGTYYVRNTASAPCQSINQEFEVVTFGADVTNPMIPFADEVVICPNDGKELPNFFLCGAGDVRYIQTNITDTSSIIWEKLDEASCAAVLDQDCANEDPGCTWNEVETGPNYLIDTSGQYRLTLNYTGGCFNQFYFNVYTNLLEPTVAARDIYCTTPGEIVVGGVPSGYEYSLDGSNFQPSNTFIITTPNVYSVFIRQIGVTPNPCVFYVPNIQVRESDFTASIIITQPLCNGELGSVILAANDVRPQYFFSIYDGATLVNSVGPIDQNSYTFPNLNPGIYTVNISTEDGCTHTEDIEIINPPLLDVTAALTAPLTCTDGEITVYPVGGTPPYFYFVNSTTVFQTTPIIPVTSAGTFNIMVVDSNNCPANTSIVVDATPAPDFTVAKTDILCADDVNSGSITINVTNPNGSSLQYSIDNGATFTNSPNFTGLTAGDYNVIVEYTFGADVCLTTPVPITIIASIAISGTATLTTPYTCTTNGVITVSGVSGGDPPYMYSIDGVTFQTGTTFTGLTEGTYTVTIRDANSCTFVTASITIDPLDPPTDLMFTNTQLSCPTLTSDVTITGTTGGTLPLEYQIIAPIASATAYQTSNIFTGLAPGTYTFQVRDANDCVYSESYTINPLDPLSVVGQTLNDITCFGASDGEARFTVSGSTSFTYTINGGASTVGTSPIDLTGLSAGNYTIIVTDDVTNCTATASIDIDTPTAALTLTTTISPITCIADGSVAISATDGWGGYTYSITLPDATVLPVQGSNVFSNLTQTGDYTATVTDARGCIAADTFTLDPFVLPVATINTSSDFCYDTTNGATIEVTVSAGQAPFEYSINGGPFGTNNIFSNLTPGNYDIIVRDAYGCTVNLPTQIITDQLTATATLKGLDCTVTPDAEVDITVSGGTAPYTFEVSFNSGPFTATVTPPYTYNDSQIGDYQYRITDALGCITLTNIVTIQPIANPLATAIVTDVFCNGDASGIVAIDVDETLGVPPYQISFNGSAFTSQIVYNGLASGSYNYIVRDGNSCVFNGVAVINEPSAIVLGSEIITPITCGAGGNILGAIEILGVTGGTPNYTYTLFDSSGNLATTSSTNPVGPIPTDNVMFNDLVFGNYYLRIVDANGCEFNFGPYLVASDVDELDITATGTGSCLTGVDYDINIVNGVGPFRIRIYDGNPIFNPTDGVDPNGLPISDISPNERNHQFSGLLFGVSYVFEVLDIDTGCSYLEQVPAIPRPSTITVDGTATNITCLGLTDGIYDFTVSLYNGNSLSWEVFNNLTNTTTGITGNAVGLTGVDYSDSITGLAPGDYYLLVTETQVGSTECTALVNFQITEPTELLLVEVVNTNANCNQGAQVVVNASGGIPPYEYAFVQDGVLPVASNWTTNNLAILDPSVNTNWDVYVRDANACDISTPLDVVIASDPLPTVTLQPLADDQCASTGNSYTFTATPGGGEVTPVSYSIDGTNFQSSPTFVVSSSGTYTVTIRDGNGCTATDTITIYPPLGLTPAVTALPTCPDNDGEITVTAFGGSGAYTYEITSPIVVPAQPSGIFTGLAAGIYTVRITDTTTLCTADATVDLDAATPVMFATTPTDVSCNGGNDGTITVNLDPSNDNPIYTYEITAPIMVAPQTSNVFTGLAAGNYTVQVTSGRGCSATEIVPIGQPNLLTVSGTATPYTCALDNSVNTSTLIITEVGGTFPFTFSIDGINYLGTNTFEIIDTGSPQTINIYVQDANGCIATDTVAITPLPTLTAAVAIEATPIDCNNTGSVAINVTGGSGNFTYQMLPSGMPQATNTFSIDTPGDYTFQVNDIGTGCFITTVPYTVAPYDNANIVLTPTSSVTCFGDSMGAFELLVNNYTGTYDYEVFDSSGTSINGVVSTNTSTNPVLVTGIPAGNYTVAITETASPFCTTNSNVITIDSPIEPLILMATETSNVTCDDNNGTITAVASGGWGTYEYELTGAATVAYSPNGTFANLSAGTYTVNVRDAGGCIATENVPLVIPPPIMATATPNTSLLSCFGDDDATITVNATGGQGNNYSYTLNMILPTVSSSGPQSSNIFSGLGAGTYNVLVTDTYNCVSASADIVIGEPTEVQASLVLETAPTCLNEATLTLSATGGTGSYEYSDDASFTSVLDSFTSSTTILNATPGTYMYYVRDANGCVSSVSNDIDIDPLPDLMVNLDTTNATVNCTGDSTGVIIAIAEGGLGNYIYTLQDGSDTDITPAPIQTTPGVFTDLPIGTYQVQVESGDCLSVSAQATIEEPLSPLLAEPNTTDVTCTGSNDGIMEVIASGGTGIIKYAISPQLNQFFVSPIFEDLAPGNYQGIAQDELGCFVLFDFDIDEPITVTLMVDSSSIIPEVCSGDLDGSFSVDISGGTLPYSYSLDDINGTYTTGTLTQTRFDFDALAGGNHVVYIRDAQGCESEWEIEFPESVLLDPMIIVDYGCTNNLSTNTVTVTVDDSVNPADLDYSLNGSPYQTSNIFTDVPPGVDHYIDVRHTNGCIQRTEMFDIVAYEPLTLVLSEGALNEIVATAAGGTGDYEFTLNGESYGSTNTFLIYETGNYTVVVTDSNGCFASATIFLEYVDVCIPNYFTPNNDGIEDEWGPGCSDQYRNLTFDIFDRYGRKIATLRIGDKWDGKYKGKELPTGDYWYVVRLNDDKDDREFVGHFTLYR